MLFDEALLIDNYFSEKDKHQKFLKVENNTLRDKILEMERRLEKLEGTETKCSLIIF